MGDKQSRLPQGIVGDDSSGHEKAVSAEGGDLIVGVTNDDDKAATADTEETFSEGDILVKLVTTLGQCPGQSLPLVEIISHLPPNLRKLAGDSEGVCRWLKRFGGLLEVSGSPGQERVTLVVLRQLTTAPTTTASESPEASPTRRREARPAAPGPLPAGFVGGSTANAADTESSPTTADDEGFNPSSVQLRGLPFRATIAEIRAFLGEHVEHLRAKDSIKLLLNRDGRPSGFARVYFTSPQAAQNCREALHRQQMGERYIEVLGCSDRQSKTQKPKKAEGPSSEDLLSSTTMPTETMDAATEQFERERILQECRVHMSVPGRQNILLSMLGIALSEPARNYLRRVNLGLKHFLARHQNEFRVEGQKGCEKVFWLGNIMESDLVNYYSAMAASQWAAPTVILREPSTPKSPREATSPVPKASASQSHHGLVTPSDWGTPGPNQAFAGAAGMDFGAYPGGQWAGLGWPPQPWGANSWPLWPESTMPPPLQADDIFSSSDRLSTQMNSAKGNSKKTASRNDNQANATTTRSHAHLHPQSHPFASRKAGEDAADKAEPAPEPEIKSGVAALRLRGLPFSVNVQDVLAFFSQHDVSERISDAPNACTLLPKANGRPSGQAVVQMRSRYDAEVAARALNNQFVGMRYIEVFVYGDEDDGTGDRDEGAEATPDNTSTASGLHSEPTRGLEPPDFSLNVPGTAGLPWGDWAQSYAAAAPWALPPWSGLTPPPVGGLPGIPPMPHAEATDQSDWNAANAFATGSMSSLWNGLSQAHAETSTRPTLQV